MPKQWTIHPGGVSGGSAGPALVGCHISENTAGTLFHFEAPPGPSPLPLISTSGTTLPAKFPKFKAKLAGTASLDWYITITSVTAGPKGDWAAGTWGNTGYLAEPEPGDPANDPSDTWVAQAGAGLEEEASSASA